MSRNTYDAQQTGKGWVVQFEEVYFQQNKQRRKPKIKIVTL